MGQPSTTHERTHRSSSHHHHHRTISSTTLLLALSLILAVLAITLSIPSYNSSSNAAVPAEVSQPAGGIWGYLTPKRAQGLAARENALAFREYEVARREAELFGTTIVPVPAPPAAVVVGTPCAPEVHTVRIVTETVTVEALPTSTIVKEVVKEVEPLAVPPPPWWKDQRVENLYDREQKVSQREKEVGSREETVGKRESDAAKREAWVMEQLINLGQDKIVEEEVVYETPGRRKPKTIPIDIPAVTTEYISTRTVTVSEPDPVEPVILPTHTTTVTVAMPSATRLAAYPAPEVFETPDVTTIGRTTEVPVIVESTTTINVAQTQTVRVVQAVEDDVEEEEYDYDYDYEDYEEPEQVAVKTVRRVKPGRRNFKKWWSE